MAHLQGQQREQELQSEETETRRPRPESEGFTEKAEGGAWRDSLRCWSRAFLLIRYPKRQPELEKKLLESHRLVQHVSTKNIFFLFLSLLFLLEVSSDLIL